MSESGASLFLIERAIGLDHDRNLNTITIHTKQRAVRTSFDVHRPIRREIVAAVARGVSYRRSDLTVSYREKITSGVGFAGDSANLSVRTLAPSSRPENC